MEKAKILEFLKFNLNRYYVEHIVEFFYYSKVEDNKITSTVGGKEIKISAKSLRKHFDIGHSGWLNRLMKPLMRRHSVLSGRDLDGLGSQGLDENKGLICRI